jgi:hypothetical protein
MLASLPWKIISLPLVLIFATLFLSIAIWPLHEGGVCHDLIPWPRSSAWLLIKFPALAAFCKTFLSLGTIFLVAIALLRII